MAKSLSKNYRIFMKITTRRITALDLGSKYIKMAVADIKENTYIPHIISHIKIPSQGIKNGMIINIEDATSAIIEAKQYLEKETGSNITSCFVGLSGEHIMGINTTGRLSISKQHKYGLGEPCQITQNDVDRVLEHTKGYELSSERDILNIFSVDYIVDGRGGIKNPVGIIGRRLQVNAHLTTYETTAVANITTCLERAGIQNCKYILQSLASAESTLDSDEKKHGVILLDIGSDITDIIVYYDNKTYYTGILNMAGYHVSWDISALTGITTNQAEQIKLTGGVATEEMLQGPEIFMIEGVSGRLQVEIQNYELTQYIKARLTEILNESKKQIQTSNLQNLELLVCLCGGTAKFNGFDNLANKLFSYSPKTPNITKIGIPTGFTADNMKQLSSPEYSALIGLLQFGSKQKKDKLGMRKIVKESFNLWDKLKQLLNKN